MSRRSASLLVLAFLCGSGSSAAQQTASPSTPARLTSFPGQELNPSLSPDGEAVAFDMLTSPGNRDIYLARGSAAPSNLTADSPAADVQPAFSPDGSRIAFRSSRNGGGIFVVAADGGAARRLTEGGFNPEWSPDGGWIVYSSLSAAASPYGAAAGVSGLWAVDVETGRSRQISTLYGFEPVVSPGGRRIAFWALGDSGTATSVQRDIWTIAADGSDPVRVTDDAAVDWSPAWSPDGAHLYFASDRDGAMQIWRVSIDERTGITRGGPVRATTDDGALIRGHLSISRSGRMAYMDAQLDNSLFQMAFDPARGASQGAPTRLSPATLTTATDFDVSPDGEWVAFRSAQGREDLYVVRADGTGLRQLTDDEYRDRSPRWSPDGAWIAFRSDRPVDGVQGYRWYRMRPDGSAYERLLDVGPTNFSWSPDGSRIATRAPTNVTLFAADGSGQRTVAAGGGAVSAPVWSPDGSRIAWQERVGSGATAFLLDVTRAGAAPEPLPARDFLPVAWSSEGDLLLGNEAAAGTVRAAVYDVSAGAYQQLPGDGTALGWLATGARALIATDAGSRIHLVDRRSGNVREVMRAPASSTLVLRVGSDDGTLVYHLSDAQADIHRMPLPR